MRFFPILLRLLLLVTPLHDLVSLLFPLRRTHVPTLLMKLQRFQHPQHFPHVPANGQIVETVMPHLPLIIYNKCCSEMNSLVLSLLHQTLILLTYFFAQVRNQGEVQLANASLFKWSLASLLVGVDAVDRAAQQLCVEGLKLGLVFVEFNYFCGTHKSEIQRVEEKDNSLVLVVGEAEGLDLSLEVALG